MAISMHTPDNKSTTTTPAIVTVSLIYLGGYEKYGNFMIVSLKCDED